MLFAPAGFPRIVVKIGSALLVDAGGAVRRDWLATLVAGPARMLVARHMITRRRCDRDSAVARVLARAVVRVVARAMARVEARVEARAEAKAQAKAEAKSNLGWRSKLPSFNCSRKTRRQHRRQRMQHKSNRNGKRPKPTSVPRLRQSLEQSRRGRIRLLGKTMKVELRKLRNGWC